MKILKTFIFANQIYSSFANQSVEEILKEEKLCLVKNQNAKKFSILLVSKRRKTAKPLMKKISDNYKKLLDYFPENTKEGFKTAFFQVFGKIKMSLMH